MSRANIALPATASFIQERSAPPPPDVPRRETTDRVEQTQLHRNCIAIALDERWRGFLLPSFSPVLILHGNTHNAFVQIMRSTSTCRRWESYFSFLNLDHSASLAEVLEFSCVTSQFNRRKRERFSFVWSNKWDLAAQIFGETRNFLHLLREQVRCVTSRKECSIILARLWHDAPYTRARISPLTRSRTFSSLRSSSRTLHVFLVSTAKRHPLRAREIREAKLHLRRWTHPRASGRVYWLRRAGRVVERVERAASGRSPWRDARLA